MCMSVYILRFEQENSRHFVQRRQGLDGIIKRRNATNMTAEACCECVGLHTYLAVNRKNDILTEETGFGW